MMKALIGIEFKPNTLKGYISTVNHLQAFVQERHDEKDVYLSQLDYSFIEDFDHFLKTERSCSPVSAAKYLKNLRKIINNCLKKRMFHENPFLGYRSKAKPKEREFLTQAQLDRVIAKKITIQRIDQVRDVFVFCCYTGLSYADVKKLTREEVMVGIDGNQWVFTNREKTQSSSRIPLLNPAVALINKYKDHPICEEKGLVLPVLSNQKMNAYLKEIADLCEIPQNLTFHLSRHTFATTVTLTNGVPIESVSKMLGHVDIKTTQHYAKVLDLKVSADMEGLKQKFANA